MSKLRRQLRQTLTIARRDFIATVFTPIFLLFLFAPVIMGSFGAVGGLGAATVATSGADKVRAIAIVPAPDARTMSAIDKRLRVVFRGDDEEPPQVRVDTPGRDPAAQAQALFRAKDVEVSAVLYGPLDRPTILYGRKGNRSADYLGVLAEQVLRADRSGGPAPLVVATKRAVDRAATTSGGRNQAGFLAVFGIFFLTLFLSGQVVGTMAEERNNKVIEVLAAAVPLESVFLGKLLGMFGVAILFVGFWGTIVSQLGLLLPAGAAPALADLAPAVGTGPFVLLFAAYFTMAYLLLGAVFLGVGAQASTMREIQLLSLPVTILQVAMFGLAASAMSRPDSWLAKAVELFPLSSPYAMAGRAARAPELWPHLAALAWQALWVTIFIVVGARLFRRGVLQSGSATPAWRKLFARTPRRTTIDTAVS